MDSSVRTSAFALLAVFLAGCAMAVTKDSPLERKQEAVRERAAARWELIIKGQAAEAYDFFSSASKQVIAREDFAARMGKTAFRTASVEKVECSTETCQATVRITYDHPLMKGVRNTMVESWVIDSGKAWYVWSP